MNLDDRVLVLMPTAKDRQHMGQVLAAEGVPHLLCHTIQEICHGIELGAAVALLTEEAVTTDIEGCLKEALGKQPPWSDFPLVVLARERDSGHRLRESMNATLVERPVRFRSLISVIRSALRSRQHQYDVRDHLAKRQEAEEALRQADRRKDEFLAILAHELRNPLAPLRNSINILQLTESNDAGTKRLCETMERQVNHLVRLVDDLLEVSRITRGKIELRKETVAVAAVMRNAIETSRPTIDEAEVQLAISLPQEPILVDGDFVRLAQVFANLLNNAAKYTNRGGQIWFTAKSEHDEAVISLRDSGIVIPPEHMPNVFDLFMQVDKATNRSQGGLGIGLTLVRNLVELHHGRVTVHSDGPGRGSEFVVRLPVAHAEGPTTHRSPAKTTGAPPSRRILVVDDNADSATTLGMLLKLLGVEMRIANDGPTALAAVEEFHPQIILLDIGMPDMDGFEVARRLRQRPEYGDVLLIALTGWGQEEDRRRTREAGFDHHLVKPVALEALQAFLALHADR